MKYILCIFRHCPMTLKLNIEKDTCCCECPEFNSQCIAPCNDVATGGCGYYRFEADKCKK
jgi:hypothetical protein